MGLDAPVFLVGPARSGSSLLYKSLCLHPQTAYVSNWVRRFPAAPQLAALNRAARALPATRRSTWFDDASNAYVYNSSRSLLHRAFPMAVEGEPMYGRCGIAELPMQRAASRPDLGKLRRTIRTVMRTSGGSVFVNKRIANNTRIPLLLEAFPGARFVFLVRDGRAVAYSLSRVDWWAESTVWWYGGTPGDWAREGKDPWVLCARNWVADLSSTEEGLLEVPPGQRLQLRYEDFVTSPMEHLQEVARFAGLPADRKWDDELSRLSFPDRNEAWRTALDESVRDRVTAIQKPELDRWGYDA